MPPWGRTASRNVIAFRSVNTPGAPDYHAGLQRHHLLPRQLLSRRCFGAMFADVGRKRVGFDDFRRNGLLLPATESASVSTGMPLHRGPHPRYNEVVIARVGQIEAHWSVARYEDAEGALHDALLRLHLLQGALRRQLLAEHRRILLNRRDPLGAGYDFSELDEMAESLWSAR